MSSRYWALATFLIPFADTVGYIGWLVITSTGLSFAFLPGWVVALVCAVGVLCALPFRPFRMVVPLALLTWGAGWLVSTILRFASAEIVALVPSLL